MSITGLCMVCERREATQRCQRCGRLICEVHYEDGTGYCTRCAAEVGVGRGGTDAGDGEGDLPDDADVYR